MGMILLGRPRPPEILSNLGGLFMHNPTALFPPLALGTVGGSSPPVDQLEVVDDKIEAPGLDRPSDMATIPGYLVHAERMIELTPRAPKARRQDRRRSVPYLLSMVGMSIRKPWVRLWGGLRTLNAARRVRD